METKSKTNDPAVPELFTDPDDSLKEIRKDTLEILMTTYIIGYARLTSITIRDLSFR